MAVEREGIAVDITASVGDFVGGIGQALSSLTGFRAATVAAAGATAGFFAIQSTRAFATYEQALGNAARKHGVELAAMKAGVDALAATTDKFSKAGLANALDAVAQGSRSPAESFKIVAAGVALADAKNADLVESTEAVNNVLEAFSLQGEEAARVADVLFAASDFSGQSIADLGADLVATRAKAEAFGLTLEDQAALVATLGSKGLDAKQMFGSLSDLQSPSSSTSQALLSEFGVKAHDAEGQLRPFADLMTDLKIRLDTNGRSMAENGRILASVYGDRAGPIIHSYLMSQGEIVAAHNAVTMSSGATAQAIATDAGTTQTSISELEAVWGDFKTTLGEAASPAAIPLLEVATTGLDLLGESMKERMTAWGLLVDLAKASIATPGATEDVAATLNEDGFFTDLFSAERWENFKKGLETIKTNIATWWSDNISTPISGLVNDAKTWLSDLGANIVSGVKDFGGDLWTAIKRPLNDVKQKWNEWMTKNSILSGFINGVGNAVDGLNGSSVAPPPAAPAASPGSIVVQGDIVTTASNAESLVADITAKAGRSAEYTANYRSLNWRRGSTWG